jgi:hypothetical protein
MQGKAHKKQTNEKESRRLKKSKGRIRTQKMMKF